MNLQVNKGGKIGAPPPILELTSAHRQIFEVLRKKFIGLSPMQNVTCPLRAYVRPYRYRFHHIHNFQPLLYQHLTDFHMLHLLTLLPDMRTAGDIQGCFKIVRLWL